MDATEFTVGSGEQLNAADIPAPVIVTITGVTRGPDKKQPLDIATDIYGPDKPFRPALTVRREIFAAWGKETTSWIGHSMEIHNDPTVIWGGKPVGGIRLRALSHIDKPMEHDEKLSRTKSRSVLIQPLATPSQRDWAAEIAAADIDGLKQLWGQAPQHLQADIETRAAQLKEAQ